MSQGQSLLRALEIEAGDVDAFRVSFVSHRLNTRIGADQLPSFVEHGAHFAVHHSVVGCDVLETNPHRIEETRFWSLVLHDLAAIRLVALVFVSADRGEFAVVAFFGCVDDARTSQTVGNDGFNHCERGEFILYVRR